MPGVNRVLRVVLGILGGLAAVAIVAAGLLAWLLVRLNTAPDGPPRPRDDDAALRVEADGALFLEVREGESARSVGARLEAAGVIRSRYLWEILSRWRRDPIKAGSYRIEIPADQTEIHDALTTGSQILVTVTVPEGVTLKKTARILADAGVCGEAEFISAAADPGIRADYRVPGATLEGYLYPDTYRFPLGFPADRVARVMADTFFERVAAIAPESADMDPEQINRVVIIASIVEREYRVDEEAALMAGVFYNRLDIGMALQSCATVEYVITEIQGRPHPEVLYNRDIEIRDPYNTYVIPGLPPGPISAPGRVALDAAFHPAPSDYLYFRLVEPAAGRHYFSRTLDDHIKAGALYVKNARGGSGS